METFKIYLDGSDVAQNDVPDMSEFTEVIERDYALRGIVFKYPNGLQIYGDTYRYMLDKFLSTGFCGEIDVRIQRVNPTGADQSTYGTVFLSDINWDWDKCTAEITLEDNNWGARISNNINTKVNVQATKTKNDLDLDTPVTLFTLNTFNPSDAKSIFTSTCKAMDVNNVFNTVLEFITDNTVSFASNYLTNADFDRVCLTTGLSLRTTNADDMEISLQDLLQSVARFYNLWWYITDNLDGTYTLQMEHENDVFTTDIMHRMDYVAGITQGVADDLLISGVTVGGDGEKDLDGTLSLPYYRLYTHLTEDYHTIGTCNIDKMAQLSTKVIADTNAIEDIIINNNKDYDQQLFLIEYEDDKGTLKALKYSYTKNQALNPPFYYNEGLLNVNVLQRYEYPNPLAQSYGDFNNTFVATLSTDSGVLISSTTVAPVIFDTEESDPGNNYNPANGRYTAPGNGTYTFRTVIPLALLSKTDDADNLSIKAQFVKRNAGVVYDTIDSDEISITGINPDEKGGAFEYVAELVTYLQANETMEINFVFVETGTITFRYYSGAQFTALAVYDGGGTYTPNEPSEYKAITLQFEGDIPDDVFSSIRTDKTGQLRITRDGVTTMNGWIKKIERNFLTTATTFELITNLEQSNKIGS